MERTSRRRDTKSCRRSRFLGVRASGWPTALCRRLDIERRLALHLESLWVSGNNIRCSAESSRGMTAGLRASSVARARSSALLTAGTAMSRHCAASDADQLRTWVCSKTARCRGGRYCSAATKDSRILSLSMARSSGSLSDAAGNATTSGMGSTQLLREREFNTSEGVIFARRPPHQPRTEHALAVARQCRPELFEAGSFIHDVSISR